MASIIRSDNVIGAQVVAVYGPQPSDPQFGPASSLSYDVRVYLRTGRPVLFQGVAPGWTRQPNARVWAAKVGTHCAVSWAAPEGGQEMPVFLFHEPLYDEASCVTGAQA